METPRPIRLVSVALLAVILVFLSGCRAATPAREPHDADVQTIKDGEILWVRNWSTRDAERIVAHYSDDAVWMAPHRPAAVGREAIRELVKTLVQDANLELTFEPSRIDTAKSGDLGYSQGTYAMTVTNPVTKKAVTDEGTYVRIYRRGPDGSWRAIQEINTSSPNDAPATSR